MLWNINEDANEAQETIIREFLILWKQKNFFFQIKVNIFVEFHAEQKC